MILVSQRVGIKQTVKKRAYQNNLEQHLLVNLHELLVPLLDLGGLLAGIGLLILGGRGVVAVVLAPLNDLAEDCLVHLDGIGC